MTSAVFAISDARAIQLFREAAAHTTEPGSQKAHAFQACDDCPVEVRDYVHCRRCGVPRPLHEGEDAA